IQQTSTSIAVEPAPFTSPADYLQGIPGRSSEVLTHLQDASFNHMEALSEVYQNVFKGGGLSSLANQLGITQPPEPTGSPVSPGDRVSDGDGGGGIHITDTGEGGREISELSNNLSPGDSVSDGDGSGGIHITDTGEGGREIS